MGELYKKTVGWIIQNKKYINKFKYNPYILLNQKSTNKYILLLYIMTISGRMFCMYLSNDEIDFVRKKINIVSIIKKFVSVKKKGEYFLCDDVLSTDKINPMIIDEKTGVYYSADTNSSGDVFDFLMNYLNIDFYTTFIVLKKMTYQEIDDKYFMNLLKYRYKFNQFCSKDKKELIRLNRRVADYYIKHLDNDLVSSYIKKRQLDKKTLTDFKIGYAPDNQQDLVQNLLKLFPQDVLLKTGIFSLGSDNTIYPKFYNRLMFPIMNKDNNIIGFGGRILSENKTKKSPKYLNSPNTNLFIKSYNLYGFNLAKESKSDSFIICEGYMDTISLHEFGFNNAVASLGTALTKEHIELLSLYKDKVYLAYDSDAAGVDAALRASKLLKNKGFKIKCINMKPFKDPDEFLKNLGPDEYQKRIDNALDIDVWLFKQAVILNDTNILI